MNLNCRIYNLGKGLKSAEGEVIIILWLNKRNKTTISKYTASKSPTFKITSCISKKIYVMYTLCRMAHFRCLPYKIVLSFKCQVSRI